ncbi:endothelin-converting enzyme homolog [Rhipicephalus microplus]|uniref:endothelin-converting enzyme homolog n=1 Tax=Rhipicephalus microplus TaxID=6941 RepID=UPI003F6AA9AA
MDNMDEKGDPCDDFYTYACGSHQKGGGADALNPVDQVRAKVASDLSEIFQNLPNITEADSARDKVALAYHVCMNSELSEEQERAVITIVLAKKGLGQWPLFSSGPDKKGEPQSVEDVLEKTGLSSIFEIDVVKDKAGHSAILLGPLPPKMYFTWHMIDVLQNSSDPDDLKPLQISALKTAVKMLMLYVEDDQVEQYANSVVEFADKWVKLQEAAMSMERATKNSTAMTINEIESEIPSVPWLKLFNNEFKKVGTTLTDAEIIEVFALDTLKGLVEFYSENVVSAYNSLGAYEAHNLLWYSSKAYRDAIAEMLGKKAGELEDMAGSCEKLLTELMPEVVSKLYVENNFNDGTKWQARYFLNAIGKMYYEKVMRVPWADQESKKPAMEKIWNIVPYVGYAPWLMNASFVDGLYENVGRLRRSDSMSTITQRLEENALMRRLSQLCDEDREPTIGVAFETVGMIYIPPNVLVVPAGILQTPFFEPGLPSSVNFGTIGTVMAHEMTVDLIQKDLHYDSRGMIRRWWTDYTQASFYDRAGCLLKQYGSIVDTPANMTPDEMNRLIEAVADNAALRIAFQALLASAEEKPMMLLPGLEKFSPEQLYFLSYASLLCAHESSEGNKETGVTSEPFLNRYRVNVPMMNMEEFSSTFQCPSGSRMRLEDGHRCALI